MHWPMMQRLRGFIKWGSGRLIIFSKKGKPQETVAFKIIILII